MQIGQLTKHGGYQGSVWIEVNLTVTFPLLYKDYSPDVFLHYLALCGWQFQIVGKYE